MVEIYDIEFQKWLYDIVYFVMLFSLVVQGLKHSHRISILFRIPDIILLFCIQIAARVWKTEIPYDGGDGIHTTEAPSPPLIYIFSFTSVYIFRMLYHFIEFSIVHKSPKAREDSICYVIPHYYKFRRPSIRNGGGIHNIVDSGSRTQNETIGVRITEIPITVDHHKNDDINNTAPPPPPPPNENQHSSSNEKNKENNQSSRQQCGGSSSSSSLSFTMMKMIDQLSIVFNGWASHVGKCVTSMHVYTRYPLFSFFMFFPYSIDFLLFGIFIVEEFLFWFICFAYIQLRHFGGTSDQVTEELTQYTYALYYFYKHCRDIRFEFLILNSAWRSSFYFNAIHEYAFLCKNHRIVWRIIESLFLCALWFVVVYLLNVLYCSLFMNFIGIFKFQAIFACLLLWSLSYIARMFVFPLNPHSEVNAQNHQLVDTIRYMNVQSYP